MARHTEPLRDLPTEKDGFPQEFVKICDKYRKAYKCQVELADLLYNPCISYIEDHVKEVIENDKHVYCKPSMYHLNMSYKYHNMSQILLEARCSPKTCFYLIRPIDKFITAIYVPEHIMYVAICIIPRGSFENIGSSYSEIFINTEDQRPTSELLDVSKKVPVSPKSLVDILDEARKPKHKALNDHPLEKIIDGVTYKRVVLAHPFLPCGITCMLEFPEECTFYIEETDIGARIMDFWSSESVSIVYGTGPVLIRNSVDEGTVITCVEDVVCDNELSLDGTYRDEYNFFYEEHLSPERFQDTCLEDTLKRDALDEQYSKKGCIVKIQD